MHLHSLHIYTINAKIQRTWIITTLKNILFQITKPSKSILPQNQTIPLLQHPHSKLLTTRNSYPETLTPAAYPMNIPTPNISLSQHLPPDISLLTYPSLRTSPSWHLPPDISLSPNLSRFMTFTWSTDPRLKAFWEGYALQVSKNWHTRSTQVPQKHL